MPYYMYVALQEDDKISVFTIDPQTGKLTPQVEVPVPRRAVHAGDQPGQEVPLRWMPRHSTAIQLSDQPGQRRAHPERGCIAGGLARLYIHGPQRQVCAVGLLPGRTWRRYILLGVMDRLGVHPSNGWQRRQGPTRCRPTRPIATHLCLTSLATDPTPSSNSGSTKTPAVLPQTRLPGWSRQSFWARATFAFTHPWTSSTFPTSRTVA